ncbi:membrane protein [Candidatus Nitromaritima sp. SCGC AAA799-C22]|nr:membrane protein [Candidatus Nitromaritima sp. SCGC AAA799-C22]
MNWISTGAVFSGLSVALGALGAHGLKNILSEKKLSAFHTATEYMGYHGLALVLVGILCLQLGTDGAKSLKKVGRLFTAGIFMFSGSIYALTFDGPRLLGPVTPLGGLCFITGWFIFAGVMYKHFKTGS